MKSNWKGLFGDKNLIMVKIVLTLMGLIVSLSIFQYDEYFAFSQSGFEPGSVPGNNSQITPGMSSFDQSPAGQALPGFVSSGKINSVIDVPNGKWLATGNWSLILNDGNVTVFETKMTWYNSSGTNAHTHELTNFKAATGELQTLPISGPSNQINIKGFVDVASNNRISWYDVPTIITINDRKIVSISVDDNKTNHHFGGQPLLGIVDSFTPCSDVPGPNMELLPPCSMSPDEGQGLNLGNDTSTLTSSEQSLPYGSLQEGVIPGEGMPLGGIPPGGIPPGDEQNGGQGPLFEDQQSGGDQDQQSGGQDQEMNSKCTELRIENITANGFESDPSDFHPPSDAIDGSSSTWWSYNGNNPWVEISLNEPQYVCGVSVQWNKGDERKYSFEIEVSKDGNNYEKLFEGTNKEGSTSQEVYPFEKEINAKFVKLTTTASSSNDGWVSIQEINPLGFSNSYNQTGGSEDNQTGTEGIPPGGIPPFDNQTSSSKDNQTGTEGIPPGGIPPGGIPPGGIPPFDNQTSSSEDNQTGTGGIPHTDNQTDGP